MNYFFTCYNVLFGRSFPRLEETLSTESKLAVGNRDYFVSSFEEVKKHYQAMIDKWKGTKLYADDDFPPLLSEQYFIDNETPINPSTLLNGDSVIDTSTIRAVETPTVVKETPSEFVVTLRNMVLLLDLGHRYRKSGVGLDISMCLSSFLPALSDEVFVNEYLMGAYNREISLFTYQQKMELNDLCSALRGQSMLRSMLSQACVHKETHQGVMEILAEKSHVTYGTLVDVYKRCSHVMSSKDPELQQVAAWLDEVKVLKNKCREWRIRRRRTEFARYKLKEELLRYKHVRVVWSGDVIVRFVGRVFVAGPASDALLCLRLLQRLQRHDRLHALWDQVPSPLHSLRRGEAGREGVHLLSVSEQRGCERSEDHAVGRDERLRGGGEQGRYGALRVPVRVVVARRGVGEVRDGQSARCGRGDARGCGSGGCEGEFWRGVTACEGELYCGVATREGEFWRGVTACEGELWN